LIALVFICQTAYLVYLVASCITRLDAQRRKNSWRFLIPLARTSDVTGHLDRDLYFFWLAFTYLTRASHRHLGFFHYLLFFFSIYWVALELYVDFGSVNDRFLLSVVLYPVISLLGMLCGTLLGGRTNFSSPRMRLQPQHVKLVLLT
jgi:hypothetical protein